MACICCGKAERTKNAKGRQVCPNCGEFFPVDNQVDLVYGTRWTDRVGGIDLAVTDKYLMVHKVPGQKGATAAFGVVGWMVSVGADKMDTWAYYDRREFKQVIFPYRNKKCKDDWGIKFVNHDGTDFIIRGQFGTTLAKTADSLKKAGFPVVDGGDTNHGDRYCDRPFLTEKTLGTRISPTASGIARMNKGCFVDVFRGPAEPRPEPKPQPQPQPMPRPQPAPQPRPAQSAYQYQRPQRWWEEESASTAIPVPAAPEPKPEPAPAPEVKEPAEAFKFCHECGNKLLESDKFCVKCGTRQREI